MPCYYGLRFVTYLCIIFNIYCDVLKKYKLVGNIMSRDGSRQALLAESKTRQKIASSRKAECVAFNIEAWSGPEQWRRQCGCIRTSDKLKQILKCFPPVPPPSPTAETEKESPYAQITKACYVNNVPTTDRQHVPTTETDVDETSKVTDLQTCKNPKYSSKLWRILTELFQLLQLWVTATALALYYIIYCYMQLVYFALRSALYFHQADGPMKLTIAVVSLTSLVIGFNMLQRMEKLFGIEYVAMKMA